MQILSSMRIPGIIDSITIYNGRIKTIVFKKGLSHTFVYRQEGRMEPRNR